jgi:hypothetical protein
LEYGHQITKAGTCMTIYRKKWKVMTITSRITLLIGPREKNKKTKTESRLKVKGQ